MAGTCDLEAACLSTDVASLDLYPVLRPTRQAHELLGWAAERVMAELVERYDYVIADGPPVLPVPDTPLSRRSSAAAWPSSARATRGIPRSRSCSI